MVCECSSITFYEFEGRVASAVEITPVKTVVAKASQLLTVEQGADISTRLAAIETVPTGTAMVPVSAKQGD